MNDPWDAQAYDKISSNVQLRWGQALLEKRKWLVNEIVMDAGAGSGNLTRVLADKVPKGQVYAVDADPAMVEQAKANLSGYKNVQVIHSGMDTVVLPMPINVVFSNAALHWVPDLERTFSHFWKILKPGGELLIECGGHGNLERQVSIIFNLMQSDQFREYFVDWKQPWHFPKEDEAETLLKKTGFIDIKVSLSKRTTIFSDRQSFAIFAKTVIMNPFLGYLPADKKEYFLDAFLSKIQESGWGWSLDNMRLFIFARK